MIYLDNAATTRVSAPVLREVLFSMSDDFGNPGSVHRAGRDAKSRMEYNRDKIASCIGARSADIIFTSGGSESNTLALIGLASYLKHVGKTHIITSEVEHASVIRCMEKLEQMGFTTTKISVDRGCHVDIQSVIEAIKPETGLVSIMLMNNETGSIVAPDGLGSLCRQHSILLHMDCVQAFGTVPINVEELCVDFMSVSGHKIHAQKGTGFLYARHKNLLSPIVLGGGQEFGIRSGTENVPGITGMRVAAECILEQMNIGCEERYRLVTRLLNKISSRLVGVHENGERHRHSKIVNLRFDGVNGETLVILLDSMGVCVSAGSACNSFSSTPSHVLTACGLTDDEAKSSIRISISDFTTEKEIDTAVDIIVTAVEGLRKS